MDPIFVYVTCKNQEEAQQIGKAMVKARLAACANIIPKMQSIYWWEDKLVEDEEAILILKSTHIQADALTTAIKNLHNYTVPCVVILPILGGNSDYMDWIRGEIRAD